MRTLNTAYVKPIETLEDEERRVQLSNLVAPFTLRRKKESVLHDLPEKIEDMRICTLSEDQVKLYRDAVSAKGNRLLENLRQEGDSHPLYPYFCTAQPAETDLQPSRPD